MSALDKIAFWRRAERDETRDDAWKDTVPMATVRLCGGLKNGSSTRDPDPMCATCRRYEARHDSGAVLFVPSRVRAVWDFSGVASLTCADRVAGWNAND